MSGGVGRALRGLAAWIPGLTRKELAGVDAIGNKYYKWMELNDEGEEFEKREVDYADREWDPHTVPVEWRSWLHGTRTEAPTMEEMERLAAHRLMVKAKAKALEEEEAKRRYKAKSLGQEAAGDGGGSVMSMIQQIQSSNPDYKGATQEKKPAPGEHKGSGDTFEPGTWKPGQ